MKKNTLYFTSVVFLLSCGNKFDPKTIKIDSSAFEKTQKVFIADTFQYESEQKHLSRKRILSQRLALYDIEQSVDSFELRIWQIPSMWDPSILYILKSSSGRWTLLHYEFYTLSVSPNYDDPNVDSVIVESLRPRKTTWDTYIGQLKLDSLWNLVTESAIPNKKFSVVDGHRFLIEMHKSGIYKYLIYTTPEYFQQRDSNHKWFMDFKERLITPILYNGIRNP